MQKSTRIEEIPLTQPDRRGFCKGLLGFAGATLVLPAIAQESDAVRLQSGHGRSIPPDYVGLSYETMQLADPTFFSADNRGLIALFRDLSPSGVLRIGGNSSEFCWWQTDPHQSPPPPPPFTGSEENWMPHRFTAIEPKAIDQLAGFLDATGWKAIYGLNLGTGTPARAAEEASYVARVLGSRLLYFQIGNEPEYYRNPTNRLRSPDWDFDQYMTQWSQFAHAVLDRVPNARFGGPDVGSNASWVIRFAEEAPKLFPEKIVSCTGHYYAEGPPDDPSVTVQRLLSPDPRIARDLPRVVQAAEAHGLSYRMTEGNSCYRGGKPGMSNAFCSALWAADYMLKLASYGCVGVNLHGGGTRQIKDALGGHLPGESAGPAASQSAQEGSFYTPIAGSRASGFVARPIFYGMKLAGMLAGGRMRSITVPAANDRIGAYAADMPDGSTRIVFINKDSELSLPIHIASRNSAKLWHMEAPELTSTTGVTLAGESIQPQSAWKPKREEHIASRKGMLTFTVKPASAVILFSNRL